MSAGCGVCEPDQGCPGEVVQAGVTSYLKQILRASRIRPDMQPKKKKGTAVQSRMRIDCEGPNIGCSGVITRTFCEGQTRIDAHNDLQNGCPRSDHRNKLL